MMNVPRNYLLWALSGILCFNNSFALIQAEEVQTTEEPEYYEITEEENAEEIEAVVDIAEDADGSSSEEQIKKETEVSEGNNDEDSVISDEGTNEENSGSETSPEETETASEEHETAPAEEEYSEEKQTVIDENVSEQTSEPDESAAENSAEPQKEEPEDTVSVEDHDETDDSETQASTGVTYKISGGTLTISGSGFMEDYWSESAPWKANASQITRIVVEKGITYIGAHAFDGLTKAVSVSLPSGLKTINAHAFNDCSSLTSVTIPYGVEGLMSYSFSGCKNLKSISIPSTVKTIGSLSFWNCENLVSVDLPGNITDLGYGLFYGCSRLSSITIPNKVKTIGAQVFANCTSLKSVTIPNSVTSIGDGAFICCSALTSVSLPDSVTSMDINVFASCSSLISVTLPKKLTRLEKQVFSNCTSLREITIPASLSSIGEYTFSGCSKLWKVYYDGTRDQWNKIYIATGNDPLKNASVITGSVKAVISAIDAIGNVTLTKEQLIKNARTQYNSLSSSEQVYVTNYQTLVKAEQSLSVLKVNNVISLITKIGNVSLGSQAAVTAARNAYNKLSSGEKSSVTNYSDLVEAESRLSELQIQNVIELIDGLGDVTLTDETAVKNARTAYDKLTESQQESITNYSDLIQAEEVLSDLQIQNVISLINSLPETVSLEDKDAVAGARAAYDKLSAVQKKQITNYSILIDAETVITKTENDHAAANAVMEKINALSKELTIDDAGSIKSARQSYDALSDDQKALVTNYDVLAAAESRIAEIEDLIRWGGNNRGR